MRVSLSSPPCSPRPSHPALFTHCTSSTPSDGQVAIEGCSHGELDSIYATIAAADAAAGARTELVLLCGDFQSIRNSADLACLAVPDKYRRMGDFHRYYSGASLAPYLTIVIGGNHEASNHLHELFLGGWLAPNIYYLGAAGCVEYRGLVVAGISGIYKANDYARGRYERMPYSPQHLRSIYHTRRFDVQRLQLLPRMGVQPDVFLSHDWPNTIEQHGDLPSLLKRKPFFKEEVRTETLGSPPLLEILRALRPRYWFAAHLHCKFAAKYRHTMQAPTEAERSKGENKAKSKSQTTDFLALGKCVPNQDFLQVSSGKKTGGFTPFAVIYLLSACSRSTIPTPHLPTHAHR